MPYTPQPGPMGWGTDNLTENELFTEEARAFDQLAALVPYQLMRQAAKQVVNQDLLNTVHRMIKDDGWDEGFTFRHLFKAIMQESPDWKAQLIGSCVASGDMRTTSYRMLSEVFLLNDPENLPGIDIEGRDSLAFFAPYSYRAGRREAGINGMSDGSLCLPHIKGKMKYGHLPCSVTRLRSDTFPEPQNTRTYKQWGSDNRLMNTFLEEAGRFKLLESEPVRTPEDTFELITEHFKPMNICSMWAFRSVRKLDGRDTNGRNVYLWSRSRERWAHNMSVVGVLKLKGIWYAVIENSWANFHNGNQIFLVEFDEFARWLQQAECQSVGEMDLSDNGPAFPE